MTTATNIKVTRDEKAWEAEISAEIPADAMQTYRAEALKEIQKTAKLDGFRPGKAPEDAIIRVYGEAAILREAAEHAIQHELPEILAKEELPIVESPRVSTGTPESGKPLAFTARASLAPKVELPDYESIAKKVRETKEDTSVSDTEHKEALTHLRRERARIDKIEAGTEPQKAAEESRAMKDEELPALDDEFVQSLGYADATAFEGALRENIKNEKELKAQDKRRTAILDEIIKKSTIKYPASLRDYELDEMEGRLRDDLQRLGRTLEQYLAETKKTREELRSMWTESADQRAKVRLVLAQIAAKEKIEPGEAEVAHEIEHAKQHYPQASADQLRPHVLHAMRNEMTLRWLEGNHEPVGHTAHDH